MFKIEKVDNFPEISRSGRVSEELNMIVDALHASAEKNERFCINGITAGNAYNSMQQRIRTQAKKLNYKVIIRYDAIGQKLYFRALDENAAGADEVVNASVKASEVKGVKNNKKAVSSSDDN